MTQNGGMLPRFTIRRLLAVVTGCAILFTIAGTAMRGQFWAIAFLIAFGAVVAGFLVYAAVFAVVWMFAEFAAVIQGRPKGTSPFADSRPPPQFIRPEQD